MRKFERSNKRSASAENGITSRPKFALGKDMRCMLVNACSTRRLAMELSAALPDAYVIGMREPVGDRSAIAFSGGFYQAVAAGRPKSFGAIPVLSFSGARGRG